VEDYQLAITSTLLDVVAFALDALVEQGTISRNHYRYALEEAARRMTATIGTYPHAYPEILEKVRKEIDPVHRG